MIQLIDRINQIKQQTNDTNQKNELVLGGNQDYTNKCSEKVLSKAGYVNHSLSPTSISDKWIEGWLNTLFSNGDFTVESCLYNLPNKDKPELEQAYALADNAIITDEFITYKAVLPALKKDSLKISISEDDDSRQLYFTIEAICINIETDEEEKEYESYVIDEYLKVDTDIVPTATYVDGVLTVKITRKKKINIDIKLLE